VVDRQCAWSVVRRSGENRAIWKAHGESFDPQQSVGGVSTASVSRTRLGYGRIRRGDCRADDPPHPGRLWNGTSRPRRVGPATDSRYRRLLPRWAKTGAVGGGDQRIGKLVVGLDPARSQWLCLSVRALRDLALSRLRWWLRAQLVSFGAGPASTVAQHRSADGYRGVGRAAGATSPSADRGDGLGRGAGLLHGLRRLPVPGGGQGLLRDLRAV
jgi:hypothetical protein